MELILLHDLAVTTGILKQKHLKTLQHRTQLLKLSGNFIISSIFVFVRQYFLDCCISVLVEYFDFLERVFLIDQLHAFTEKVIVDLGVLTWLFHADMSWRE